MTSELIALIVSLATVLATGIMIGITLTVVWRSERLARRRVRRASTRQMPEKRCGTCAHAELNLEALLKNVWVCRDEHRYPGSSTPEAFTCVSLEFDGQDCQQWERRSA